MISACVVSIIIGIICIVIGIYNIKGNLSTIHSYHRHRVAEHNKAIFGKLIGVSNIIIGSAISVYGVMAGINYFVCNNTLLFVAGSIMITGILVGIALSFYTLFKYNKGIF